MNRLNRVATDPSTAFSFPEPTHRSRLALALCPSSPEWVDDAHTVIEQTIPDALGALGITGRVVIRFSTLRGDHDDLVAGAGIEIDHDCDPDLVAEVVRAVARHVTTGPRFNQRSLVVDVVDHRAL